MKSFRKLWFPLFSFHGRIVELKMYTKELGEMSVHFFLFSCKDLVIEAVAFQFQKTEKYQLQLTMAESSCLIKTSAAHFQSFGFAGVEQVKITLARMICGLQ